MITLGGLLTNTASDFVVPGFTDDRVSLPAWRLEAPTTSILQAGKAPSSLHTPVNPPLPADNLSDRALVEFVRKHKADAPQRGMVNTCG